ncbi:Bifunctional protein FolD protein [Candidatus Cyrtobacter comes]|uniref:Bifunctional protein FolD n=1 Tax=Candidatus Cyrtobacter comes TaxID=675776 RepID=A0ABU5L8D8_9RICK|nr:bifunctional 5,10-methylenetetrahydrofolate dehydrogenase/5,10-methenyltetrahydrofolate cyclohydrolase [Candidatus Cyrtobacter comes]MDZ5762381.1 Bifunctional protein FolD protein [Candidatus Cyrtobacter comes]
MVCRVVDGKRYAKILLEDIKRASQRFFAEYKRKPKLNVIFVGNNESSNIYVRNKKKRAEEVGVLVEVNHFEKEISQELVVDCIESLNLDSAVDGIIVQLPVPPKINPRILLDTVMPQKDVDGFSTYNSGLMLTGQDCFLPCTPQGVLLLIKKILGNDISGKKVGMVGRSLVVGMPLSILLIKEGCTVTVLHSQSLNIEAECKLVDILISATGSPSLIKECCVKTGAFVIDVGISRVDGSIVGDVDFQSVKNIASYITPVPGGVGQMTVASLMLNTIKAAFAHKGTDLDLDFDV